MDVQRRWQNVHRASRQRCLALASRPATIGSLPMISSRREQAIRLVCVAAETGARFVRERIEVDPMHWLLAPHRMFDDQAAIDACSEPEGFRRAIALHGLSLGLDAAPESLADIPAQEFLGSLHGLGLPEFPPGVGRGPEWWEGAPSSLYSCSISSELDDCHVQIFCAMIARGSVEVRRRLRHRYGPLLESEAKVRLGFDWSEPLACALVSGAMADLLSLAADEPTSSLAEGLDFQVEQRFAA